MDHQETLKRITQEISELPTLPTVVTQMISMVNDPKTTAADLARVISTDQALTAKILRLVNSAFYGFQRKIGTVNLAIVILGFEAVKNLSLSLSIVKQLFSDVENTVFDHKRFWEHSVACAMAGRLLSERLKYRTNGEAFAAGVLHDVGKLVLSQHFREELELALDLAWREDIPMHEAESAVIGVTHAEIGGELANMWNLPSRLAHAIAYHHDPAQAPESQQLAGVVHLADILAQRIEIGSSGNPSPPEISEDLPRLFSNNGILLTDEERFLQLGERVRAELYKTDYLTGLLGSNEV